jgi:hypothetical protein
MNTMKNDIDFVWDYSDLNIYHIRVHVLTGEYAGLIFELGGSGIGQDGVNSTFVFEYTLYQKPTQFEKVLLKGTPEFEQYISEVILKVIETRQSDPEDTAKLRKSFGVNNKCKIEINSIFYTPELVEIANRFKGVSSWR